MINIGKNEESVPSLELVLQVKDNQGNLVGKTKSIKSDRGADLSQFWNRYNGYKNNKRKAEAAKSEQQINQGLKEAQAYTEKIRKKRRLED